MIQPTRSRVLLEVREKKLASGIILEGQGQSSNEFFIVSVGKDVEEEYKIGMQAHIGVDSLRTRQIDGKTYAIVEAEDILALE